MVERTRDDGIAPLWRRAVALALDWMAMWTIFFAMQLTGVSFWVLDHHESVAPRPWGSWFLAYVTVAALLAVLEIAYTALVGQSPGMDVLGIRVEERDGRPREGDRALPLRRAARRWLLPGLALTLPVPYAAVALGLMGLPALVDHERRTLADRLAGTRVVSSEVAVAARRPANVHVVRFAMEKWLGAVSGDHTVVKATDPHAVELPERGD